MSLTIASDVDRPNFLARWRRRHTGLFNSPLNAVVSCLVLAVIAWVGAGFLRWAAIDATWSGTAQDCQAGGGACWAFVRANIKLMLFATYPLDLLWRPIASLVLMAGLVCASMVPRLWGRAVALAWVATPLAVCLLLGGFLSGRTVSTNDWGGLPLTLLIATIAFAAAFVVAVPLALGRRTAMGGARLVSIGFIELIRGMPMLVVLYVSSLIVPMMLPGFEINLFFSIEVALTIFVACYLAEVIRAGIQALPAGQEEAARALGLSYWQTMRLVILPQALRIVIPALVNLGIGVILSTPLVAGIGMIDFLGAVRIAAGNEQVWPGCYNEAYLFAAAVYFALCFGASRYSLWLERRLQGALGRAPREKAGLRVDEQTP
jgi:general L-amino acid transport system permease protein